MRHARPVRRRSPVIRALVTHADDLDRVLRVFESLVGQLEAPGAFNARHLESRVSYIRTRLARLAEQCQVAVLDRDEQDRRCRSLRSVPRRQGAAA